MIISINLHDLLDSAEHVILLMLLQVLSAPVDIHEHRIDPPDILHIHLLALALGSHQRRSGDQLDGVTQGGLFGDLGQQLLCVFSQLHIFLFASDV